MSKFRRWNPLYLSTGMMILLSLYALVFVLENQWWKVIVALWIIVWMSISIWEGHKQTKMKLRDAQEFYQQQLIRTMNHHRHDWMNELQVLFGYIRLKKYEYLLPYSEKIRDKLVLEGAPSKLGIPSLIAFLMTFRSSNNHLQLNVTIDDMLDLSILPINPRLITDLVSGTLTQLLQEGMDQPEELAQVHLNFDGDEYHLLMNFHYSGRFQADRLNHVLHQTVKDADKTGKVILMIDDLGRQANVTIRVPFRTI